MSRLLYAANNVEITETRIEAIDCKTIEMTGFGNKILMTEDHFIEMCKHVLDQIDVPVAPRSTAMEFLEKCQEILNQVAPKAIEYEYRIEEITSQSPGAYLDPTTGQWETMNLITALERFTVDSWELINVTWRGAREMVLSHGPRLIVGYYVCVLRREKIKKGE